MSLLNKLSASQKALVASFLRVLAAAALSAYLTLGKLPTQLDSSDVKVVIDAVVGAAGVTLVNYFRSGETRFGVGADQ